MGDWIAGACGGEHIKSIKSGGLVKGHQGVKWPENELLTIEKM